MRVELRDYLDLPEDALYDKIASVGMFEHVGIARFPKYFGKIRRILKPGGLVLNHGITHNPLGADSLGSGIGDFVEEYVFPGGELAHVAKVIEGMAAQGLEVIDAEALREHYAKTLWQWCERLEANADAARAEVGEEKYRVWRIYLAGSAHAFERGWLSLWQLLAGKPLPDGRLPHPLTRAYMYPGAGELGAELAPVAVRLAIAALRRHLRRMMTLPMAQTDESLLKFPDRVPDQGDGAHAGRLRAGDRHGRAEARAGLRAGDGRDARVEPGQVPVADLHGQRGLARAARRPLSRSHVASDGGDGAVGAIAAGAHLPTTRGRRRPRAQCAHCGRA